MGTINFEWVIDIICQDSSGFYVIDFRDATVVIEVIC